MKPNNFTEKLLQRPCLLRTHWVWAGQDCKITPTQAPQVFVCLLLLTDEETESQRNEVTCPRCHSLGSQISKTADLSLSLDVGIPAWAFHAVFISRTGTCKEWAGQLNDFEQELLQSSLLSEIIQNTYPQGCRATGSPLCPQPQNFQTEPMTAQRSLSPVTAGHSELEALSTLTCLFQSP